MLGADHPSVATGLVSLGRTLHAQGRCAEAEPLLREAVAIRLGKLDPQSADVASAREILGPCLVALRKFSEAEPILLASYPALKQLRGEDHELTRRARSSLAKLYQLRGRPEQASAYER